MIREMFGLAFGISQGANALGQIQKRLEKKHGWRVWNPNGEVIEQTRSKNCPGCGVGPNTYHEDGCDVHIEPTY